MYNVVIAYWSKNFFVPELSIDSIITIEIKCEKETILDKENHF